MSKRSRHNPEEYDFDFTVRKTVHVKLYTETHSDFKMRCAKLKLSMQEIFQELAQRVVDGDKRVIQVLEDYKRQKRNRETDTLVGKADVKEIFSLIRDSSPIKEAGED